MAWEEVSMVVCEDNVLESWSSFGKQIFINFSIKCRINNIGRFVLSFHIVGENSKVSSFKLRNVDSISLLFSCEDTHQEIIFNKIWEIDNENEKSN